MWKHIRTTLLILLVGTLIGVLVGMVSVPGKMPSAGKGYGNNPSQTTASGGRTNVDGNSYASGAETSGYAEPVAIERTDTADMASSAQELRADKEAAGITEASVAARMEHEEGHYCYDMLDQELRKVYVEILMILEMHGEDLLVSTKDPEDLHTAFLCVFQDHPEIYWCDGYYYRHYQNGLGSEYLVFGGRYTYTEEECAQYESGIRDYVRGCLQGLRNGADQYETVKYIYEYVILHTDYDLGARDSQNILSVMIYGDSVCQGYAKTVQYLCQEVGIPATLVTGRVFGDREGHAWDLVKIDGGYYYLDATWGDAGFQLSHGDQSEASEINYRYLNVTSEDLSGTHVLENPVPMPYCVSMDANYYVREGLYLSGYDTALLRRLFAQGAATGSRTVSVKLANDELYREVRERLLDRQEIFDLLPSRAGQVSFNEDAGLRILTFWY